MRERERERERERFGFIMDSEKEREHGGSLDGDWWGKRQIERGEEHLRFLEVRAR